MLKPSALVKTSQFWSSCFNGLSSCCCMWRLATPRKYVSFISRWRGFHTSLTRSNWMLSNDIVRNALTSKNVVRGKPIGPNGGDKSRGPMKKTVRNRTVNKNKTHHRKSVNVTWTTGSDRDKEAANAILSQIFRMNKAGTIKFVNSTTSKLEETNIRLFAKGINLEENGILIVNFESIDENTKIPLVKLVDRKTALKRFSDDKAKQKEKEMINLGLLERKPVRSGDGEKTKENVKQIKISWQIKNDDLNKQKSHEITNQLKKGYKVHLYIDDKSHINSKNWAAEFDSPPKKNELKSLGTKELSQREAVLQHLMGIVDGYSTQPVIEGSVENRMLIKLAPKAAVMEPSDKQSLKEQRKKERQERLQQRIEKKRRRNLETEP